MSSVISNTSSSSALIIVGANTGVGATCADQWVQRRRHHDHCCTVLGCSATATKDEFYRAVRTNRARFHPENYHRNANETDEAFIARHRQDCDEFSKCITVYTVLRDWDSASNFADPDKIKKTSARNILTRFLNVVTENMRSTDVLHDTVLEVGLD